MDVEEKFDNLIGELIILKDDLNYAQKRFIFWKNKVDQRESELLEVKTRVGHNLNKLWELTAGDEIMDQLISDSINKLNKIYFGNPVEKK